MNNLWCWFGCTRASWLTLPRAMMHEMPEDWQEKLAELLNQWDEHWVNPPDIETSVTCKKNGKFIKAPTYLVNYRHPDKSSINIHAKNLTGQSSQTAD